MALKQFLVGEIRDHFDEWQAEKFHFEELLRKVKEQARLNKLDTDVLAGVAVGSHQPCCDFVYKGGPCFGQSE
ncbi:hypothetical protein N9L68_04365 [bacterium]|nr:hypothetical protein [bacterium]